MLVTIKNWWHQEEVCKEKPDLELSVTKLMIGMMAMDGRLDVQERVEVLHLLNVRFGLAEEQAEALMIQAMDESRTDLTYSKIVSHIEENYTLDERKSILSHVWSVALSDSEVDFKEERFINRLSMLIGVSSEVLSAIKKDLEKQVPNLKEETRYQNPNI